MLNFNLREVSPGETIRAEDWNALVGLLRELTDESNARELHVGDGLELHKSSSGSTLLLDIGDYSRDEPETNDYEHPFKVTAAWTVNDAGAEILRVHVARGAWTNSSRINSNNFASQSVEIEASNFDLPASTKFKSVYFVCPLNYVGADEGPHFLVPDPVNECYVSPEYPDGQNWVIQLAAIEADASQKTAKVYQYWRSDITIPDMLATTN